MVMRFLLRAVIQATIGMTAIGGGMHMVVDMVDMRDVLERSRPWPERKGPVTGQVWHHTDTDGWDVERINDLHRMHRKWPAIAYHYVIKPSGTIVWCNDIDDASWHTQGANKSNIGIAIEGRLHKYDMTPEQKVAAVRLMHYLRATYGAANITMHKDHRPTVCPGKYGEAFVVKSTQNLQP